MVAQRVDSKMPPAWQRSLFAPELPSTLQVARPDVPCDIIDIEKRRDGGTRYWCRSHRADATDKGGKPASKCRAAGVVPIKPEEVLTLDLDKYLGGVALWGAVPAVYDTTRMPMDRGIHVHARPEPDSPKEMDFTRRAVLLVGRKLPKAGVVVSEVDAIYYMVSTVFNFPMIFVECTHCGWPHLDKDWFSVHPHRRHLCNGCGRLFRDRVTGIGNPIIGVRDACGAKAHKVVPAPKKLDIKQSDFPGGIQIWGSNAAFLWTGDQPEEEGIHVHAFEKEGEEEPTRDDTFSEVTIDGITLDPVMVRVLMAQNVMPSLKGRVRSMECPSCGHPGFDSGEAAFVPAAQHTCSECGRQYQPPGRTRNVVVNPLPAILAELARMAPRTPQRHQLDLLPETL